MVDISYGRSIYTNWLRQFEIDDALALKIRHINNLVGFARDIAVKRGLPDEDVALAEFIAQHHDDGRFKQWTVYKTFNDKEICQDGIAHPHAELSLEVLFEDDMIHQYAPEMSVEEMYIVYKAIAIHGDLNIDHSSLDDRQLLHLQIVRDADMLDNMVNVKLAEDVEQLMKIQKYSIEELWSSEISDDVYATFESCKSINYGIVKTPADWWVTWMAYLFNLSTPESLQIVRDTGCVKQMFDRVAGKFHSEVTNEKFEALYQVAESYIDSKMA